MRANTYFNISICKILQFRIANESKMNMYDKPRNMFRKSNHLIKSINNREYRLTYNNEFYDDA